jgi:hypothetical protein
MRRKKFALGVLLLAFLAGFTGAMTLGRSNVAPPEDTASMHCAADPASTYHPQSNTWRPTS